MSLDLVVPEQPEFLVTDPRKLRFLEATAAGLSRAQAAAEAGVNRLTTRRWEASDPSFAALCDEARESATDAIETALHGIAVRGGPRSIEFWLKNRRPEAWSEHSSVSVEHSAKVEDAQAQLVATAMVRALDRMGLTPEQLATAPLLLAEELRALEESIPKET